MSRYKSEQTAYNLQQKKEMPIWRLDTNTLTVNPETLTEEHKTYQTDYIRYHLHYSDSKYPDRLRRLVKKLDADFGLHIDVGKTPTSAEMSEYQKRAAKRRSYDAW